MHELTCVFAFLGNFLYHISPALVTVGLGAYVVQRFFVSRANQAALIDLLVRRLEAIQADSLEYWNLPCDSDANKQHERLVLAQKIKGAIFSTNSDMRFYCARYCSHSAAQMAELMCAVLDTCTGGDFESSKKQPDAARYLAITNAINRVRSELFKQKL